MAAEKEDTKKEADAKATEVRDRDVTPPAPSPRAQPHREFLAPNQPEIHEPKIIDTSPPRAPRDHPRTRL